MFWITQESRRQKVFTCLHVSVSLWRRFSWFHALLLCLLQGIKHSDHFGFICRDQLESGPSQYVCFVFQCASESLVSHTRLVIENNLILLFWAPRTSLCAYVLSHLCTSGGWGDAYVEAGLLYSGSSAEQQNRDPAMWSLPHSWPAQTLRADWRWVLPAGLVSDIIHEHIDPWGLSEIDKKKIWKWDDYFALLCLQVSTHPGQR